jgi:hypothetical protein
MSFTTKNDASSNVTTDLMANPAVHTDASRRRRRSRR